MIIQRILKYIKSDKIKYLEKGKDEEITGLISQKLIKNLVLKLMSIDYGIKEIINWLKKIKISNSINLVIIN